MPLHWNDPRISNNFSKIENDEDFWKKIPCHVCYDKILYEPECYITSRSIPIEWTQNWLDNNQYPKAKLFSVGRGESKTKIALEQGIEVFLDDSFDNYCELNKNNIDCYLYSASHNLKYDVGHKRIDNIDDFYRKVEIKSL